MAIKYQVFVSSTYVDLVEERQAVSRAILDMGHIPAGMEMFPAADIEQLTYIKKVIDECDYYVLIIGARYGSLDEDGVSYTEREFDYAVETGTTVLVFVHADIDQVPLGKTDKNDAKREKLLAFIEKASTGRLIQRWDSPIALRANAIVSLQKAFSEMPQIGWVRADTVATSDAMADIIKYREQIDDLRAKLETAQSSLTARFEDAADLSTTFDINYSFTVNQNKRLGMKALSFLDILICLAPTLHSPATIGGAESAIERGLRERHDIQRTNLSVRRSDVQDILLHLVATGHVKMWSSKTVDGKQHVTGYQLTPLGVKTWQENSYIKA